MIRRAAPLCVLAVAAWLLIGAPSAAAQLNGSAAPASTKAPATRPDEHTLDAWIDSVRVRHDIPAMAAIVLRADTILARGVAGVRRYGKPGMATLQDRFQLGSNTKAITATLLATLVEAGKLSWTTTLADVFPESSDAMSSGFRGVTVDQLLSHHAGVSPFTDTEDKDFRSIPHLTGSPMAQRRAFTAWITRSTPVAPPGTRALYSNADYTIAAAIAERLTGESWESMVRSRVFTPLGIHGTLAWSDSAAIDQPWGHYETRSGVKAVDPRDPSERVPPILWPAGAVELSVGDYATFLQLHLRGLEHRDMPLLRAATIQHLHTSPVAPGDNFALGWGVQELDGALASVHVGSAGTFYAITILQPTRDIAVAVLANAGGERAAAATKEAIKALFKRYATPGATRE